MSILITFNPPSCFGSRKLLDAGLQPDLQPVHGN